MPPAVAIQIDVSAVLAVARRFEGAPARVTDLMRRGMDEENLNTVSYIIETKLTAAGPKFLNVQSGRLRRSIRASAATVSGNAVRSIIGSNVRYAAIHEFGFNGQENVRAHERRVFRHLNLRTGGRLKRRVDTGGRIQVRGFARRMNMPARASIRTGIAECAQNYGPRLAGLIRLELLPG